MTRLRRMMLEELERRNYSASTICIYIRTVEEFARYFKRSPDHLGPEHIRRYQAHLFRDRGLALIFVAFLRQQRYKRVKSGSSAQQSAKHLYYPGSSALYEDRTATLCGCNQRVPIPRFKPECESSPPLAWGTPSNSRYELYRGITCRSQATAKQHARRPGR